MVRKAPRRVRIRNPLSGKHRAPHPAAIDREIADIQAMLLTLAKDKTEQLYLATIPTALPDVRRGIRIKAG